MEQRFLDAVKQAWGSADVAPEPVPPAIRSSEDSGPWPLPLYPVLGEPWGRRGDFDAPPLSSPCWQLPPVYLHSGLFSGVPSAVEPSTAQPSPGLWPGTPTTPEAPAEAPEPAEETAWQRLAMALPPDADADTGDDGPEDTDEASARARPAEHRPAPDPAARRRHRVLSGLLQWIRGALGSLSCGALWTLWDTDEP